MDSEDYRIRAAVVRVIRYMGHQLDNPGNLLLQAANDEHGRVRLEAITAASWIDTETGPGNYRSGGTERSRQMDEFMPMKLR